MDGNEPSFSHEQRNLSGELLDRVGIFRRGLVVGPGDDEPDLAELLSFGEMLGLEAVLDRGRMEPVALGNLLELPG
jgi:hypothetical protein